MSKIMLVEDDNNLREIYEARLLAEGYEIVSAHDGEEALALAVKEKPDLIISDVMMPKISGFDMLDILRGTPETRNTKVIMMTALSQAEDKDRADKLGADRYLVKSQVTLEDVARVAREVLEGKESPDKLPAIELPSIPPSNASQSDPVEEVAAPVVDVPVVAAPLAVPPEDTTTKLDSVSPSASTVQDDKTDEVAVTDDTKPGEDTLEKAEGDEKNDKEPEKAAQSANKSEDTSGSAAPKPVESPVAIDPALAEAAKELEAVTSESNAAIVADVDATASSTEKKEVTATPDDSVLSKSDDHAPKDSDDTKTDEKTETTPIDRPNAGITVPESEIKSAQTTETEQSVVTSQIEDFINTDPVQAVPITVSEDGTVSQTTQGDNDKIPDQVKPKDLILPGGHENEPAASTPATTAPLLNNVEPAKPAPQPEEPTAPHSADIQDTKTGNAADYPNKNEVGGKKIISPINDISEKPDLNALLIKEHEKEEVAKIIGNAGVTQPATDGSTPGQKTHPDGQDPNLIAL